MSATGPTGSAIRAADPTEAGESGYTVTSTNELDSMDVAQHAQVHRTQNTGQPLSGADSVVAMGHPSGTSKALTPLASEISTARMAMNRTRRIRSIVYRPRIRCGS
jgi:hypothetical protein